MHLLGANDRQTVVNYPSRSRLVAAVVALANGTTSEKSKAVQLMMCSAQRCSTAALTAALIWRTANAQIASSSHYP